MACTHFVLVARARGSGFRKYPELQSRDNSRVPRVPLKGSIMVTIRDL